MGRTLPMEIESALEEAGRINPTPRAPEPEDGEEPLLPGHSHSRLFKCCEPCPAYGKPAK